MRLWPHYTRYPEATPSEDWLDRQLHPERIDDPALETRLARIPVASMSLTELLGQYPPSQVLSSVRGLVQG